MTPQAITKLRRTFIGIAMASFFIVIAFMGLTAIAASIMAVTNQANSTLDAIIDAGGETPREDNFRDVPFHEEASFGLRFFTVSFDDEGNVENVDLSHIKLIDRERALELSATAADPATLVGLGCVDNYFYKEGKTDSGSMVAYIDYSVELANARAVSFNILALGAGALVVTFALIVIFSKRAVRREVENAKRQQEFITNAGHELKTPIAVIRANTELTEMMSGETEWTRATMRQVDRLDGLVRDLMIIARGEERGSLEEGVGEIDVSTVVRGAADSFKGLAQQKEVGLESAIDEDVTMRAHASSVEQLVCLLVDNAIKYCDDGGSVSVRLTRLRTGRGCSLIVANDYAEGAGVDYKRFFDRFYREDSSHENQHGYGIGLSVAESICKSYRGSIKASWKSGVISFTCIMKGLREA